ncbi:3-deoxy-7-phosphoheptulonate synthase [Bacillus sp. SG-1]|nr:3-deoxy-7-phosphoheptulonate synthase [Bacillus sp. SG-1]
MFLHKVDWSGRCAISCGTSGTGETPNPVAAPEVTYPLERNPAPRAVRKRKDHLFTLRNICLSGLNRALPLFKQAQPRRLTARPAESRTWSGNQLSHPNSSNIYTKIAFHYNRPKNHENRIPGNERITVVSYLPVQRADGGANQSKVSMNYNPGASFS